MLTVKHLVVLSLMYSNGHAWRKVQVRLSNLTYNYIKDYGSMNATVTSDGYISIYVKPSIDIKHLYLTMLAKFKTDRSDNFDVIYMNKTVDVCKFSREPRYEPLIQLVYKILSQKIHLPQRCPINKDQLYFTSNYMFETDKFPPILSSKELFFYLAFCDLKNKDLLKIFEFSIIGHVKYIN